MRVKSSIADGGMVETAWMSAQTHTQIHTHWPILIHICWDLSSYMHCISFMCQTRVESSRLSLRICRWRILKCRHADKLSRELTNGDKPPRCSFLLAWVFNFEVISFSWNYLSLAVGWFQRVKGLKALRQIWLFLTFDFDKRSWPNFDLTKV